MTATTGGRSNNVTWQETFMLPCGVDAVQICPLTNSTDVTNWTGVRASVQCSDLSGTGSNMNNPFFGGVVQTMQAVTWGGSVAPTFTASPSIQTLVGPWSDWIPVKNTGVNSPSYLIVRTFFPTVVTGGGLYSVNSLGGRDAKLLALGSKGLFGAAIGNVTASNVAAITAGQASIPPTLIRFNTSRRIPSIAIYGDSTRQGYYGDGIVSSLERYAITKSLAGTPVACNSRGITSQTTAQYLARLKSDVAAGDRFDVLVWQVCSPNDTQNASTSSLQIANAMEALAVAEQIGAKIILDGPFPITAGAPSGTQSGIVNGANAFCQSMIGGNVSAAFYDALHFPGAFGRWVAAYNNAADGLHQNELATTEVILPQLTAALDAALATLR